MTVYGYARVSTKNQSLVPQKVALRTAGACVIVSETFSGAGGACPAWKALEARLGPSDELVVTRLDRIGRSMVHLVETVLALADRGVRVRSLAEQIDTESANGRMMLGMWGVLAQFERDLISERTKAGMAAAKARGRQIGRPRKLVGDKLDAVYSLRTQGHSYASIAKALGVGKTTVVDALKPTNPKPLTR